MPETELLVRFKFLFFVFFIWANIFAQKYPVAKIDSLLNNGIDKILLQNYTGANKTFLYLDKSFPVNPLGEIYLAATEIAKSVDYAEDFNNNYIDSLLTLAEKKTEKLLNRNNDDVWYNYYKSLILGYRAYYSALQNNIITALASGLRSLQSFKKCLEVNPEFYEAYIAAGTYHYWKSAKTSSLTWLPFIKDNRKKGIELLEKAVEHSSYNYYLAAYSLIWIYIDFKQSDKAVSLSLEMIKKYPQSRFFRWTLARAYEDIDLNEAIAVYRELLTSVETLKNRNMYNDVVLKHKLAMMYFKNNEKQKALKMCNEILDFEINSAKIKMKLEDRLNRVKELKQKILKQKI